MKDSQQWQCSVQILNPSAYRKFQHASLYNPLKNTTFTIQKKISKENLDPFFKRKNKNKYKLPQMSSHLNRTKILFYNNIDRISTNFLTKEQGLKSNSQSSHSFINKYQGYQLEAIQLNTKNQGISKKKKIVSFNKNISWKQSSQHSRYIFPIKLKNKSIKKNSGKSTLHSYTKQDKIKTNRQERYQGYLDKFKNNVLKVFPGFTQKDQYFSYVFNTLQLLYSKIQLSKNKKQTLFSLIQDLELLTSIIFRNCNDSSSISNDLIKQQKTQESLLHSTDFSKNISVVTIMKNMRSFKKQQRNFNIKCPQVRILFHIFLAQLEYYQNNLQKCLSQFQFCQYYCRKQSGLEILILCFMWEVLNINISLYKYQDADGNLRNLLEMAVAYRNKSCVKYILEKISLLYYYRGNSIMGQYYLKKSEQGLTIFQIQMYLKQYNNYDEIKRLQNLLFNSPVQETIIKRKNNPKLQSDIWRQSKQEFQKKMNIYMDNVNKMLKDHQNAQQGRKIKKIVKKINCLGQFKKTQEQIDNQINLRGLRNSVMLQNKNKNGQKQNIERQSIQKFRKQQQKRKQQTKFYQHPQNNVTKIIKTHLSLNRENKNHNIDRIKGQRWKDFIKFLIVIQQQLRLINDQFNKLQENQV